MHHKSYAFVRETYEVVWTITSQDAKTPGCLGVLASRLIATSM